MCSKILSLIYVGLQTICVAILCESKIAYIRPLSSLYPELVVGFTMKRTIQILIVTLSFFTFTKAQDEEDEIKVLKAELVSLLFFD